MSQLRNLINLLPYFYKEKDTYKVGGKGILERYLEIFGNYFEDYIVGDTNKILDILDIDQTPEIYLNYLWQFLGEMPFANGKAIDPIKWKNYFNGFESDSKLEELGKIWLLPEVDYETIQLDTQQIRRLLKYSISLFKIRGTQRFFEILFRIYGFEIQFGIYNSSGSIDYYGGDYDYYGQDNSDYQGRDEYPWVSREIVIDSEESIMDCDNRLDRLSTCSKYTQIPVRILKHSYTSQQDKGFYEFYNSCTKIFDRFLPINVSAILDFGFPIDFGYTISLDNFYNPGEPYQSLEDGIIKDVAIKVSLNNNWGNLDKDLEFSLGCWDNTTSTVRYSTTIYKSGQVLKLRKEGTYYIKSLRDENVVKEFTIARKDPEESYKIYNISYSTEATLNITPDNPIVKIPIRASVTTFSKSSSQNQKYLSIRKLDNLSVIEPDDKGICWFETNEPGKYTFSILDYPIKQISLEVTRDTEESYITFHKPENDSAEITPAVIDNIDTAQGVSVRLKLHRDYPGPSVRLIAFYDSNKELVETLCNYDPNSNTLTSFTQNYNSSNYSNSSIPYCWGLNDSIKYVRISCIYDKSRESSQWLNLRQVSYDSIDSILISDVYRVLFPGVLIKMFRGGFFSGSDQLIKGVKYKSGEFVEDSNYQYSDFIDIESFIGQEPVSDQIPTQLTWNLIGSNVGCYELGRPDKVYYTGEIFTTRSPGSYYFKPQIGSKTFKLIIKSNHEDTISWTLKTQPEGSLFRSIDSNNKITLTLQLIGKTKYSNSYNTIINWIREGLIDASLVVQRMVDGESVGDPIILSNSDSRWVDTEVREDISDHLQRAIPYTFDFDTSFGEINNEWKISMPNRDYVTKNITLLPWEDPDQIKLYLSPTNKLDEGWKTLDKPSSYKYSLKYGKPSFKVLGKSLVDQDLKITFTDPFGTEHILTKNYFIGQTIEDFSKEGVYRISLKDSSINHAHIELYVVQDILYTIKLDPPFEALDADGKASTTVTVTADAEVEPINLKVKLLTDTIWYDSGTKFDFNALGDYNFHCYGDPSKVVTFKVLNSGELNVNQLNWEAQDISERNVNMPLSSEMSWEAEIIDEV